MLGNRRFKASKEDYKNSKMSTTPLIDAILENNLEEVKRLLQSGVNIEETKGKYRTPLVVACKAGHFEIVKCLVESGAKFSPFGESVPMTDAFTICCIYKKYEILDYLLEKYDGNPELLNLIMYHCARFGPKYVQKLLDKGADKDGNIRKRWLMSFIRRDKAEEVKTLLMFDIDINSPLSGSRCTPLYCAIRSRSLKVIDLLLKLGAKPTKKENESINAIRVKHMLNNMEDFTLFCVITTKND